MQTRSPQNAKGIDVSIWQGDIDWKKVKAAGTSFAFLKATEGKSIEDKQFAKNIINARAVGILVGAYHFCRAKDVAEAQKEADHFINTIISVGGFYLLNLPSVLDIETKEGITKANITAVCHEWLEKVKKASGKTPLIYANNDMAVNYLDKSLAVYPLWFARYGVSQPPNAGGWSQWTFLQYTDSGAVSGISGNVDTNEYHGTLEKLISVYGGYKMKPEDANKIIAAFLGPLYNFVTDPKEKMECNRLANELRKASGQPTK
ncbi:lyzozyme M1 [Desulfocucumis palustris]|uniref:Lyzozyme M1 n=1 Tax=Desulfocucumis palustris TaxID=1898651 RepID=A0A2L2XD34_9FIRM|nr:glycoside hydrolase family 25 protein [Desulfocucumis palustris]GBF34158.1 lyzozyme M1 [Desulfocucumis palustris]